MAEGFAESAGLFAQQVVNGVTLGSVYALIAVGYTMVYGVIELINFAHGEVYMMGAFFAWTLVTAGQVPFFPAFLLTLVFCAVLGILLDRLAYRPLRNAPRLAALITAIGMSLALQNLALLIWGGQIRTFPAALLPAVFNRPLFSLGGIEVTVLQGFILALAVTLMVLLQWVIHRTPLGTAMRAIAQDKTTAALMGVNVDRVISFTFALGSALGGVAGILVGIYYNALWPTMGYTAGVKAFAAAVLGGIGSVPGAILGGGVLGMAEVMGAGYLSAPYRDGIAYAVMIAVIVVRPSGILGRSTAGRA